MSAARSSGGKNLQRAQTLLAEATGTPARCQAAFAAARQDSPLADGDFGLDDQIELAIAILPLPRPSPLLIALVFGKDLSNKILTATCDVVNCSNSAS